MSEPGVPRDDREDATDALLELSRLMTAVVARTLADVEQQLTVPQFRILVMVWSTGAMSVGSIAEELGVNASNASRSCDRLISAGLAVKAPGERDKRSVSVRLTAAGRGLIEEVMEARRAILHQIVAGLSAADQRRIADGITALTEEAEASGHAERIDMPPHGLVRWIL